MHLKELETGSRFDPEFGLRIIFASIVFLWRKHQGRRWHFSHDISLLTLRGRRFRFLSQKTFLNNWWASLKSKILNITNGTYLSERIWVDHQIFFLERSQVFIKLLKAILSRWFRTWLVLPTFLHQGRWWSILIFNFFLRIYQGLFSCQTPPLLLWRSKRWDSWIIILLCLIFLISTFVIAKLGEDLKALHWSVGTLVVKARRIYIATFLLDEWEALLWTHRF